MPATYAPLGKATASFGSTSFSYLPLLSDGDDVVSRPGTLTSGLGIQKRGTIVKIDAATGNVTLPALATDCNGILVDDTDATSAAAACNVYVGGKFKADAIIWPALAHGPVTDNLRDNDIQIESVLYTDGTMVRSLPTAMETAAAKKRIEENKADAEKAAKSAATTSASAEAQLSDSSWPYLTAEEREKSPELAAPRTEEEEEQDEKDKEGEDKKGRTGGAVTPPTHGGIRPHNTK